MQIRIPRFAVKAADVFGDFLNVVLYRGRPAIRIVDVLVGLLIIGFVGYYHEYGWWAVAQGFAAAVVYVYMSWI